ncbi:hypothetical protein D6C78_04653 [Aureobasidium pullulans]|uniref:Uncharacterized protein n=1 Tax=Aureobasidium pullulans TaxID=5580 RepID=A0A4T0BSQ3_AURPU|nr:hypothetical protein D6C78_04653 [Aureobasidium pullulans]
MLNYLSVLDSMLALRLSSSQDLALYVDTSASASPRSRQLKRWLAWDREFATPVICVTTGRRKVHTHYSAALAPGNRRGSLGRGVLLLPVSSKLKVDMDKLFGMAGYKTKASTNTAYHKLKAKIKSVSSTAEADEADAEDFAAPSSPVKKSRGKKAVLVKAESDSEDDDEADEIAPTKPTASGRPSRVTAKKHAALKAKMAARPSIGRATRASARTNKVDVQMSEDSSWVQAIEEVAGLGCAYNPVKKAQLSTKGSASKGSPNKPSGVAKSKRYTLLKKMQSKAPLEDTPVRAMTNGMAATGVNSSPVKTPSRKTAAATSDPDQRE